MIHNLHKSLTKWHNTCTFWRHCSVGDPRAIKMNRFQDGRKEKYLNTIQICIIQFLQILISSMFILLLSIAVGGDSETSSSASSVIVRQVNARGHQVWSLTQFSSVSFTIKDLSVQKLYMHTIKSCIIFNGDLGPACLTWHTWWCPCFSVFPQATHEVRVWNGE